MPLQSLYHSGFTTLSSTSDPYILMHPQTHSQLQIPLFSSTNHLKNNKSPNKQQIHIPNSNSTKRIETKIEIKPKPSIQGQRHDKHHTAEKSAAKQAPQISIQHLQAPKINIKDIKSIPPLLLRTLIVPRFRYFSSRKRALHWPPPTWTTTWRQDSTWVISGRSFNFIKWFLTVRSVFFCC